MLKLLFLTIITLGLYPVFKILNGLIKILLPRRKNIHEKIVIYRNKEFKLFSKGKNHYHLATKAQKAELIRMKKIGIKKVEILSSRDEKVCSYCKSIDRKIFSIKFALKKMPIPSRYCTGGRCRCTYLAIIE